MAASGAGRDPTLRLLMILGVLALGLAGYHAAQRAGARQHAVMALELARTHEPQPGGPSLALALASAHGVARQAVTWQVVEELTPSTTRVSAVVTAGAQQFEYRFDVDLEPRQLAPANPRARALLEELSRGATPR